MGFKILNLSQVRCKFQRLRYFGKHIAKHEIIILDKHDRSVGQVIRNSKKIDH